MLVRHTDVDESGYIDYTEFAHFLDSADIDPASVIQGGLGGEDLLRLVDLLAAERFQAGNLVQRQAREDLQEAADVAIVRVAPVLPEVIGAEEIAIEPDLYSTALDVFEHSKLVGSRHPYDEVVVQPCDD